MTPCKKTFNLTNRFRHYFRQSLIHSFKNLENLKKGEHLIIRQGEWQFFLLEINLHLSHLRKFDLHKPASIASWLLISRLSLHAKSIKIMNDSFFPSMSFIFLNNLWSLFLPEIQLSYLWFLNIENLYKERPSSRKSSSKLHMKTPNILKKKNQ